MNEKQAVAVEARIKSSGLLAADEGTRIYQKDNGTYVVRIWGVDEDHLTLRAIVGSPEGWTKLATARYHSRTSVVREQ